jgi:sugar fermentation stimulation protein A
VKKVVVVAGHLRGIVFNFIYQVAQQTVDDLGFVRREPPHVVKQPGNVEAVNAAGQPARVGLNTGLPNKLVEEAIVTSKVPLLSGYDTLKREQKYGKNSRIDILLSDGADGRLAYVEVKNVTLSREGGIAEFPDAVTERGAKHLMELADMVREGHRAVMVYLAQRSDAARFRLAHDIDPAYMDAWKAARDAGVESIALACQMGDDEIVADRLIDLDVT